MMNTIQRWRLIMNSLLIGLFILAGCGAATDSAPATTSAPSAATPSLIPTASVRPTPASNTNPARIRVVNAAPAAPPLNLTLGFFSVATNLAYGQYSEVMPFEPGAYSASVTVSGARQDTPALLNLSVTLESGRSYLLIIHGNGDQLHTSNLPETVQAVNSGESAAAVINLISDGGDRISLWRAGEALTAPLNFGAETWGAIIASGSATLEIRDGEQSILEQPIDLQERRQYTLILAGTRAAPSIISFAVSAPGRGQARALHVAQEVGALDVYLGDQLLNSGIEYGRPTTRTEIVSGDYRLSIYTAGSDRAMTAALYATDITLPAEAATALVVLGTENDLRVVSFTENLSPTPIGQARVDFLNTLPGTPSLQIERLGGMLPRTPVLSYGAAPDTLTFAAGSYSFAMSGADRSGTTTTVEAVENIHLEQGQRYLYLISGRLDNNPLILSDNVGVDDSALTDVTGNSAIVRFINAAGEQFPLDITLNEMTLINGLRYGEGSGLLPVDAGGATFAALREGSVLTELDAALEAGGRYSVVIYGYEESGLRALLLDDSEIVRSGDAPHLRLVQASSDAAVLLGLGYSTPTGDSMMTDLRRSLLPGVQQSLSGIGGGSASGVILMPTGTFDIYVIDTLAGQIAGIVPAISLQGSAHYDVVAYQEEASSRVQAFALFYPIAQ